MFTQNINLRTAGVCATLILAAGLFMPSMQAHAQLISDEQIEEQKMVVMFQIVSTLEEHVKLLQMALIRQLEAQVAYLQTQAEK